MPSIISNPLYFYINYNIIYETLNNNKKIKEK